MNFLNVALEGLVFGVDGIARVAIKRYQLQMTAFDVSTQRHASRQHSRTAIARILLDVLVNVFVVLDKRVAHGE